LENCLSSQASAYFDDNKPADDHAARSLRGGALSVAARGLNAVVQIGSVLVLARMLSPEDYGLVGMVTAFTGFAPVLVDLGTRDAIVQRTRIGRGEVSALFWITIAVGCSFALVAAASAPVIARFYGEPRLTMIVIVSSLTFVACALSVQHYALMRRVLMFGELVAIETVANVLSAAIAIGAALYGAGYWALVVRILATPVLVSVGVWARCRWMPGWPQMTAGVKETIRFGLNITGFCMTDFAGRSGDRIAIGYRTGAGGLGLYQNALFVYDNLLDVLVFPLHGVAVASLGKLRDDLTGLKRAWSKALVTLAFFAMPAFGLLAVTSQDVIVLLLGSKWAGAGMLLSVLALRGIPHSIERTLGWLHVTAGRSDRWMKWGVFASCAQFIALFCGLPYGPMGVAVAFVVAMFVLFVPAIAYAGRPFQIDAMDVVAIIWRPMAASLIAAAACFLLRWTVLAEAHAVVRTAVLAATYVVTYLALVIGVLRVHTPIRTMQSLVRGYLPPRFAYLAN
jgi:PST family polysaccharide transporter